MNTPPHVRVLHVLEATAGGTARHVTELLLGLGADIRPHLVYSPYRSPRFEQNLSHLRAAGVPCTVVPMRRSVGAHDLLATWHLRRLLRRHRPDLIHLHSSKAGGIGRLAARGTGVPVLYTPHGWSFLGGGRRGRLTLSLERSLARHTTHLAAVSESEAHAATEQVGLAPANVSVVTNSVPVRPQRPQASPGPLRLGFLGRLAPQKNPLAAVRVAEALHASGCSFHLELVGGGPLARATRRAIGHLGLSARIDAPGEIVDTEGFYGRIDALLSTATYEGMPYAILDAMAWGLPTVAFAAPGVVDVVRHEQTGLLAPMGDVDALAAQARRLVREPGLADRLGRAARDVIARDHDPKHQIAAFETLYRQLASVRT